MRIELGYPDREAEKRLLKGGDTAGALSRIESRLTHKDVVGFQNKIEQVRISDALLAYLQDLLEFTRNAPISISGCCRAPDWRFYALRVLGHFYTDVISDCRKTSKK